MKKARKFFLISLAVVVVDQIIKLLVKLNMVKGEAGQIKLLGDFFKLHFIENEGAAFGLRIADIVQRLGGNMTEETGKLILSIFSIVAVIAIGYVLYRLAEHKSPLPYYVALIFGGAIGNIIDRTFYGMFFHSMNDYPGQLFHGQVVDMFYLDIWKGVVADWVPIFGGSYTALWPIFNIADAAISIGIVVVLIFQGKFFKMDEQARAPKLVESFTSEPGKSPSVPVESKPTAEEKTQTPPTQEEKPADQ
ncbi:MAG: lipoprotein signal peptidase [Bacteroidota bacterium]